MVVLRACSGHHLDSCSDSVPIALGSFKLYGQPVVVIFSPVIQSSAGWSNALTTTSILPSPSKSAKAQPRCRLGGAASNPASVVKACHLPLAPRLRKTVLGCATSVPGLGKASTWPRDTNKSFHPSLSKSNNPGP